MSKKTTPEKKNRKLLVQMVITSSFSTCLMNIEYNCENVLRSFETLSGTMGCSSALVRFWIDPETNYHPGDALFVFTDGVPEANDAASAGEKDVKEAFFSEERLESVLRALPSDCSTDGILKAVTDAVHDFVGDAPQFDDMTMLALIYDGKEAVL